MNRILLGVLCAAAFAAAVPSHAAPTMPGTAAQSPNIIRFTVGDAQVMAFSDCTMSIDFHQTLSGVTPAEIDALLASNFIANPVETSLNVFLIQQGGRTILVDTGVGNLKLISGCGKSLEAMAAAGIKPDQVSDILITHLHLDHSAGLLGNGALMFPKATIHVSEAELDSYRKPQPDQPERARSVSELVWSILKPYVDAGKVKTFDRSSEIIPGISAKLWSGHTPGSTLYTLRSGEQELIFVGDYGPVPVIGFHHPEVAFITDQDKVQAGIVRRQMLEELARSGALVGAPHLSFPGIGHVGTEGKHFRWIPVEYPNRSPDTPATNF